MMNMKQVALGIVAHVDAGKTTLNECLLYQGKVIREMGRVDHQDAFFDMNPQERDRGITIFSKMACIDWKQTTFTLVDTPGHVDFSCEMERVLSVLDAAILVISGLDGVQSHSETIFKLLAYYQIPTFIFVNKMDITTFTKQQLLEDIQQKLSPNCLCFDEASFQEAIATANERLFETYLATGTIQKEMIAQAIQQRELFPVYFGSALKNEGITPLLDGLNDYTLEKQYPSEFGMKIFKVSYQQQIRLCYCKITGGVLQAKQRLRENEKVDQIRLVQGDKYTLLQKAYAGQIVVLKGLNGFSAGMGLGIENATVEPLLQACMSYRVVMDRNVDINQMLKQFLMLQQEEPSIQVQFQEITKEIQVSIMGEVQLEIIQNIIKERTGEAISFDQGRVLYQETILDSVVGIGHFEPLRHYAEVHVRLEPLPAGSGLVFASEVSTDELATNWQRLILTHLKEKRHKGVLIGCPITDMKITLIAGKSHLKHTEGGDFREATYRAVRQGLKMAQSVVLEPFYQFEISLLQPYLSKVLYDLDQMKANYTIATDEAQRTKIVGKAAVSQMKNYQSLLLAHSSGTGKLMTTLAGYQPCEDQQAVIEAFHYDSEKDFANPTGSIFCAHGSGFYVPYDQVEQYRHIKSEKEVISDVRDLETWSAVSEVELQRVMKMTGGRNKNEKKQVTKKKRVEDSLPKRSVSIQPKKEKLLIVDGYNLMFGWEKTKGVDFDNAADMIIHAMSSYAGFKGIKTIVVFDAYKVKNNQRKRVQQELFSVVYTKMGQTADAYIEKAVFEYKKQYDVYVASSDLTVQNVIFAQGASRVSSRELEVEFNAIHDRMLKKQSGSFYEKSVNFTI